MESRSLDDVVTALEDRGFGEYVEGGAALADVPDATDEVVVSITDDQGTAGLLYLESYRSARNGESPTLRNVVAKLLADQRLIAKGALIFKNPEPLPAD